MNYYKSLLFFLMFVALGGGGKASDEDVHNLSDNNISNLPFKLVTVEDLKDNAPTTEGQPVSVVPNSKDSSVDPAVTPSPISFFPLDEDNARAIRPLPDVSRKSEVPVSDNRWGWFGPTGYDLQCSSPPVPAMNAGHSSANSGMSPSSGFSQKDSDSAAQDRVPEGYSPNLLAAIKASPALSPNPQYGLSRSTSPTTVTTPKPVPVGYPSARHGLGDDTQGATPHTPSSLGGPPRAQPAQPIQRPTCHTVPRGPVTPPNPTPHATSSLPGEVKENENKGTDSTQAANANSPTSENGAASPNPNALSPDDQFNLSMYGTAELVAEDKALITIYPNSTSGIATVENGTSGAVELVDETSECGGDEQYDLFSPDREQSSSSYDTSTYTATGIAFTDFE